MFRLFVDEGIHGAPAVDDGCAGVTLKERRVTVAELAIVSHRIRGRHRVRWMILALLTLAVFLFSSRLAWRDRSDRGV